MIGTRLLNRYEIKEHLGDGSTATVYKALDLRLRREVALKVLLPHVRETTRKRFFQEATAAAQLNHPNIMSIFDMDEDDDRHFLVVEFVEGVPLSYYIPSNPDVVIALGQQIAMALQYAHDHHIIHRDIKPANIKVTPAGQVKIMDLGLALGRDASRVTADGMVIGTPAYLSPEQAQGHKLDHRTDIYSLGIVLFEMATGHLPFDADDITALLLQQVKQAPPSLRDIRPDIPLGLENAILKALEKNPVQRFQSVEAMAQELGKAARPADSADIIDTQQSRISDPDTAKPPPRRPKRTIRLLLADDHAILRRTLTSLLESNEEFVVVAEADNGDDALEQTLVLLPDVLLLDLNMPGQGGLDVLPKVRAQAPSVKVLVLTGREEDYYIVQALKSGANGYLHKSADEDELVDGIKRVVEGNLVLGTGIAEKIVSGMLHETGDVKALSDGEKEVLLYVAAGLENDAVAKQLGLGLPVVIEALASAMNKLSAKDRNTAALAALKRGDISLDDLHNL